MFATYSSGPVIDGLDSEADDAAIEGVDSCTMSMRGARFPNNGQRESGSQI